MKEFQQDAGESSRRNLGEDDHDLLTFGEAGERLRLEIRAVRLVVADLQKNHQAGSGLAAAQERLAALEEAAHRNSAQPINDDNFEKFFGYPGKATRNVADAPGES